MANFLKLVAVSAIIDTDKQGLPLQRQTGVDSEGNPVFSPNPCKVFSFCTTGAEVNFGSDEHGTTVIRKASGIINMQKPHHRTIFKRDLEEHQDLFNAKAGMYLEGRIYNNVPCEAFKTQVRVRDSKEYKTEERSFDTTSVVAVGDEDLLTAMKNSGRRQLAGFDYNALENPKSTAMPSAKPAAMGLSDADARRFAEASLADSQY